MGKLRIPSLLLAAAMLCLTAIPASAAEPAQSATAATIQLMKTEGTVNVTNGSGRSLTKRDNMHLYNGYHVETKAKSYAWFNLDSTKLIKLDAVSETEVRKSGKAMELLLSSGSFFFNVSSPLKEGETLNIRTATMVVGIRGTSGWFKAVDRWSTEIYVLEGTVQCSVSDPVTGQAKEATIQSGEMAVATAYPQDWEGDKCDIVQERFEPGDIDGFVLEELAQDPELCADIFEKSGLDVLSAVEATQERREQDEQKMQETLERIEGQLAEQNSGVSTGPVWGQEDPAPSKPPDSSAGTGSSDGNDSSDNTGADNPGGDNPGAGGGVPDQHPYLSRTLKDWTSAADVHNELKKAKEDGVSVVSLELNDNQDNKILTVDIPMTIPEDVELEVTVGIDVVIEADFSLTVEKNGSIVVNNNFVIKGTLDNYGWVTAPHITGTGEIHNFYKINGKEGPYPLEEGGTGGNDSQNGGLASDKTGGTVDGDTLTKDDTNSAEDGEAVDGDVSKEDSLPPAEDGVSDDDTGTLNGTDVEGEKA